MRRRRLAPLAGLALLAACGSNLEPFVSAPRRPPGIDIYADPRVAVCYNAMFTDADAVRAKAVEGCGPGMTPILEQQDMRLACPIATPIRATYLCTPE